MSPVLRPNTNSVQNKVILVPDLGWQVARLNGNHLFRPALPYPVIPRGNVIQ